MTVRVTAFQIKTPCGSWHDTGTGKTKTFDQNYREDCGNCRKRSQIQERGWTAPDITARWSAPRRRAYNPGEYDPGQEIIWCQGSEENAAIRTGTIWSAGPKTGTVWVSPDDQPRSFANMVVVCAPKHGQNTDPWQAPAFAFPNPAAMTAMAGAR